uniref:MUN domain-containing protein n=1 Tax=Timema tahoe TaxID=61484 RepID=A0A7R9IF00_9NEOP|nr:unnamed protein product [Timema tahoe]
MMMMMVMVVVVVVVVVVNVSGSGKDMGQAYVNFTRNCMDQIRSKVNDELWILNFFESFPETRVEEIEPSIRETYPSELDLKPNREGLTSPKAFRDKIVEASFKAYEAFPLKYKLTKAISFLDPSVAVLKSTHSERFKSTLEILVANNWIIGVAADHVDQQFNDICSQPELVQKINSCNIEPSPEFSFETHMHPQGGVGVWDIKCLLQKVHQWYTAQIQLLCNFLSERLDHSLHLYQCTCLAHVVKVSGIAGPTQHNPNHNVASETMLKRALNSHQAWATPPSKGVGDIPTGRV